MAQALKMKPARLRDVLALTKPRITFMVMCTTLGGLWLAPPSIPPLRVLATLLGIALVVSGSNVLNMYLERSADAHMRRTRNRPLPAGRLEPNLALWFGLSLGCVGVPLLAWTANALTGLLVGFSLLLYVLIYTPLKQRSSTALLAGAIPGAVPPLVGWTAATGTLELPGLILFAILFLWQIPHFLAIALFREEEYAVAGFRLLPHETGRRSTKVQIVLYLSALVPVSLLLTVLGITGALYLVAAATLGALFWGWGLAGLRAGAGAGWAKQLFVVSLVYLTGLFAALVADQIL